MTWRERAACRDADTSRFFPEREDGGHVLVEVREEFCDQCPVRKECLDEALDLPHRTPGIWGGTSEKQRRGLKRERGSLRVAVSRFEQWVWDAEAEFQLLQSEAQQVAPATRERPGTVPDTYEAGDEMAERTR